MNSRRRVRAALASSRKNCAGASCSQEEAQRHHPESQQCLPQNRHTACHHNCLHLSVLWPCTTWATCTVIMAPSNLCCSGCTCVPCPQPGCVCLVPQLHICVCLFLTPWPVCSVCVIGLNLPGHTFHHYCLMAQMSSLILSILGYTNSKLCVSLLMQKYGFFYLHNLSKLLKIFIPRLASNS